MSKSHIAHWITCRECSTKIKSEEYAWRSNLIAITAPDVECEHCGNELDSCIAIVITTWPKVRKTPPDFRWELKRGILLDPKIVRFADLLSRE